MKQPQGLRALTLRLAAILVAVNGLSSCYYRETRSIGGTTISVSGLWPGNAAFSDQATRRGELSLSTEGGAPARIEVEAAAATIVVKTTSEEPRAEFTWTAAGRTKEEAEAIVAAALATKSALRDGTRIEVVSDPYEVVDGATTYKCTPRCEVRVFVHAGTAIDVRCQSGDIEVEGPVGAAQVRSQYGSLTLNKVSGDLDARTSSGNVTARDIDGGTVQLETQYGNVKAEGLSATLSKVTSQSGNLDIHEVAGAVEASTRYGNIEIRACSGTLRATTSSGKIELQGVKGEAQAKTTYGDIDGSLDASFSGSIRATTIYGTSSADFELEERVLAKRNTTLRGRVGDGKAQVELATSSGNVRLRRR